MIEKRADDELVVWWSYHTPPHREVCHGPERVYHK